MKTYAFKLKHDLGYYTLTAKADSVEAAKRIVLAAEGAPEGAITEWWVVPMRPEEMKDIIWEAIHSLRDYQSLDNNSPEDLYFAADDRANRAITRLRELMKSL